MLRYVCSPASWLLSFGVLTDVILGFYYAPRLLVSTQVVRPRSADRTPSDDLAELRNFNLPNYAAYRSLLKGVERRAFLLSEKKHDSS